MFSLYFYVGACLNSSQIYFILQRSIFKVGRLCKRSSVIKVLQSCGRLLLAKVTNNKCLTQVPTLAAVSVAGGRLQKCPGGDPKSPESSLIGLQRSLASDTIFKHHRKF